METNKEKIKILGVDAGAEEKVIARLACAGGDNVARNRSSYAGLTSCRAADLIAGGGKACFWGCLGLGDCEVVCDFDAIVMDDHGLPVVPLLDPLRSALEATGNVPVLPYDGHYDGEGNRLLGEHLAQQMLDRGLDGSAPE